MSLCSNLGQVCLISDREEAVSFCSLLLSKYGASSELYRMKNLPNDFSGLIIVDVTNVDDVAKYYSYYKSCDSPNFISLISPQLPKNLQDYYKDYCENCFYYPCSRSMKNKLEDFLSDYFNESEQVRDDNRYDDSFCTSGLNGFFTGSSNAIKKARCQILKAAKSDTPVLILGETGCGKTTAAKLIHDLSRRHDKSFVRVSVTDIVPSLVESTLFGKTEGAYTDARPDCGCLKKANHGTVLIDEIGTSKELLQTKFLTFLENGSIIPVGSSKNEVLDVRTIFATNANIKLMLKNGTFRKDLFHRIDNHIIELPSLRERKEDIPAIAKKYIASLKVEKFLSPLALEKLSEYDWPGNIRDLQHCIERSVENSRAEKITEEEIDFGIFNY